MRINRDSWKGYPEDVYPSWVVLSIKVITFLILVSTLAHLGTTLWSIAETVNDTDDIEQVTPTETTTIPPTSTPLSPYSDINTTTPKTPTSSSTPKTPSPSSTPLEPRPLNLTYLTCSSLTVILLLLQTISTLRGFCKFEGDLRNRTYRWIILQLVLLVVVVLCHVIPFSFGRNRNSVRRVTTAWENARYHLSQLGEGEDQLRWHEFWNSVTFFFYFATIFFGCLFSGVIMIFGVKHGYTHVN